MHTQTAAFPTHCHLSTRLERWGAISAYYNLGHPHYQCLDFAFAAGETHCTPGILQDLSLILRLETSVTSKWGWGTASQNFLSFPVLSEHWRWETKTNYPESFLFLFRG
jgi:hypothetical protein